MSIIFRSGLAFCFTLAVFLVMSYLIKPDAMPPEPTDKEFNISITRKQRQEASEPLHRDLPEPPQLQNSPPPPMARVAPRASLQHDGFKALTPIKSGDELIDINLNANRRAIPVIAIPPDYPQGPLANDIQGWVLLEFTIAADGSVADIVVIDAQPENTFDRAAIRAIRRWSYQPKMVDGRPVAQHHMREIFRFEIVDK